MEYDSNIFSYNALHNFVESLADGDLSRILGVIETRNFENIMQQLDSFLAFLQEFEAPKKLITRVEEASEKLKTSLLEAVKVLHPEHVFEIAEEKSVACSMFIKSFLDKDGYIFSTNYDLLLYWILMRNEIIDHVDGCGRDVLNPDDPPDDHELSDLYWGRNKGNQNVYYLHGALPYFDSGREVVKEVYDDHNYLLQNISKRMESGEYPIFVTAGDGNQKLKHIRHNHYLNYCYDEFCQIDGSLVVFGFNFGPYDDHIIEAINKASIWDGEEGSQKLWSIYIGVYTDEDRSHIQEISDRFRCKVRMFDSKTAPVWEASA